MEFKKNKLLNQDIWVLDKSGLWWWRSSNKKVPTEPGLKVFIYDIEHYQDKSGI